MTLSLSSLNISPISSLFPPTSQKAGDRPISFVFMDNATGGGLTTSMALNIRPEELTRTEASRATVQQTLGGAWADDFGPGLAQINISGHTGWRGTFSSDGVATFKALKALVYTNWHAARNKARSQGIDPNLVTLTFSDSLDENTDIVLPMQFVLRRSKSRPLLMQYQISMLALGLPAPAVTSSSLFSAALQALGLGSLGNSISAIYGAISSAASWVQTSIVGPIKSFITMTVGVFNAVVSVVNAATGIVSSVISTAQSIAQAGAQVFGTLAQIASLPAAIKAQIMQTASEYSNVQCVLKNAIATASTYPDYTTLLGASNCSSTSGGEAPSAYVTSGTNPFNDVVGQPIAPLLSITPAATTAMQTINNSDPVLSPLSTSAIGAQLTTLSSGVKVNT